MVSGRKGETLEIKFFMNIFMLHILNKRQGKISFLRFPTKTFSMFSEHGLVELGLIL